MTFDPAADALTIFASGDFPTVTATVTTEAGAASSVTGWWAPTGLGDRSYGDGEKELAGGLFRCPGASLPEYSPRLTFAISSVDYYAKPWDVQAPVAVVELVKVAGKTLGAVARLERGL